MQKLKCDSIMDEVLFPQPEMGLIVFWIHFRVSQIRNVVPSLNIHSHHFTF